MFTYYRCDSEGFQILRENDLAKPQTVPENDFITSPNSEENVLSSFYNVSDEWKLMSEKEIDQKYTTMPSAVPTIVAGEYCIENGEDRDAFSENGTEKTEQNQGHKETDMGELCEGANLDSTLMAATSEAMACGSLMPLIKEELKLAIQTKRLKEGKGELTVDFNTPEPYMLTEEEIEKVKKRRVQNRDAARRFRERQKSRGNVLQKECQKLEALNTQLRYIATQLRDERNKLRARLENHVRHCPYSPPQQLHRVYTPSSAENDT